MSEWIKASDMMPPKDCKFLFSYYYGIGLGEWGQAYTIINGNSERTHESYILILHPSEINDGELPFVWKEDKIIEMQVKWMNLPKDN